MNKPIIGMTTSVDQIHMHHVQAVYLNAIKQAGGIPLLIPTGLDEDVKQVIHMIDGLLLVGGGDIDPTLFGEEPIPELGTVSPGRDQLEMTLVQEALALDKPILGICRGCQIINIAVGGDMFQDIYSQSESPLLQHTQKAERSHASHFVEVRKDSLLASIANSYRFRVNSFHHQAIRNVFDPFTISALASDGVIEAIESKDHHFVLGVQWHPEELAATQDQVSEQLFAAFVKASKEHKEER